MATDGWETYEVAATFRVSRRLREDELHAVRNVLHWRFRGWFVGGERCDLVDIQLRNRDETVYEDAPELDEEYPIEVTGGFRWPWRKR